jgi:hypothetical protein
MKKQTSNIIEDLKRKISSDLLIFVEDFSKTEIDIMNICADIINSHLDDKIELEKQIYRQSIRIKNLQITIDDLLDK